MFKTQEIFHKLSNLNLVDLPEKFTFPFNYQPHEWVKFASKEVQCYLHNQQDFEYKFGYDEHSVGKMFGVLIVENEGEIGYLAAFSGKINETNHLQGFVPPIFDVLNPNGDFRIGEKELNRINQEIEKLATSSEHSALKNHLQNVQNQQNSVLQKLKAQHKTAKKQRDFQRKNATLNAEQLLALENESKRHHFELKDAKKLRNKTIEIAQKELEVFQEKITFLKHERKTKSAKLQRILHENYVFKNALGIDKPLLQVFEPFGKIPPAGAGECAAPRLLQYAYKYDLKPLAMGEFWYGKSPDSQIREHGTFYPSCKSKCEPILSHMLQGLSVAENPISVQNSSYELDILYENEFVIAVNKPHNVLSVPGKEIKECLQTKIQEYLGNYEALLVHRLDMATSGIVLAAKNLETYKQLQKQFSDRTIKKTYTAILNGKVSNQNGKISLPLRVDLDNRPMQLVDFEHGKEAITFYQVVEIKNGLTRILFYPFTGRTHQLRVHAAHKNGLHAPILGDILYGKKENRLHLHATTLEFQHPITKKKIKLHCDAPF